LESPDEKIDHRAGAPTPARHFAVRQESVQGLLIPAGYIVTAINSSGEVVGSLNNQPFIWTRSGGFQFLGDLGGGGYSCCVINDHGEVAGASHLPNGIIHAFLWTASTGMQDLGSILGGQSDADLD